MATGQKDVDVKYFSKNSEEVPEERAYYYEVRKKKLKDKDSIFTYYTANDGLRSLIKVNDRGVATGLFIYFHENGVVKSKGRMDVGIPVGLVLSYYPNGAVQAEERFSGEKKASFPKSSLETYYDSAGNQLIKNGSGECVCHFSSYGWKSYAEHGTLVNGLKQGEWVGFNPELNQKYREHYERGELVSGESVDSLEAKYSYTKLEESPEFKDGMSGLTRIVQKNLKYPVDARRSNTEGTVYVQFIVRADGMATDFKVIKGVSLSLDQEAFRVVQMLQGWNAAKNRGMPVDVKFVYPIRYRLE